VGYRPGDLTVAAGDPVDDDFELLGGQDADDEPGRRPWTLVGAAVVVALLALVGVVWMVEAMLDGGARVQPVAAPPATSTVPPSVPAPTLSVDPIPTMPSPTPSVPRPSITVPPIPVRSATALLPASTPTPVRTTPPPRPTAQPTTRAPVPKPPGRLVRVPDVVGQRVKSAVVTLQSAGFRVSILGGAFTRPPERDGRRVIAQLPGGGSLALRGSTVVLITDGL